MEKPMRVVAQWLSRRVVHKGILLIAVEKTEELHGGKNKKARRNAGGLGGECQSQLPFR
jgi:hypothetical protein